MAAIELRFKEPAPSYMPAPGYIDPALQRLTAVREKVGEMPSDAESKGAEAAIIAPHNALEVVRGFLYRLSDTAWKQRQANAGLLQAMSRQVEGDRTPMPGMSYRDRQSANGTKIAEQGRMVDAEIRNSLTEGGELAEKGKEYAEDARAKMQALYDWAEGRTADALGPQWLQSGRQSTLEDIYAHSNLEQELKTMTVEAMFDLYEGILRRGEVDKQMKFETAANAVLTEIRDMPAAKLAARLGGGNMPRDDKVMGERERAFRMLGEFRRQKLLRMPASIQTARECLSILSDVFMDLVGTDARLLTSSAFQRQYLGNANPATSILPYTVSTDWMARRLPPSSFAPLPGWSPRISKTSSGVAVRQAR
jgi:hypothetical protein